MADTTLRDTLIEFVREVGLEVRAAELETSFLPGLDIGRGAVLIDDSRLLYPGDILHEAGHLAVTDPAERNAERLEPDDGDEMAAIAWSYAAALRLKIDPKLVFHEHGYKGGGGFIAENFSRRQYLGVPMLDWYGMAIDPNGVKAADSDVEPYPHMLRWLR